MNWSEFKQQVERWLYNFSTLFSFFTQLTSNTAGDATWSYRKEDGIIEDKTVPNIAKIRLGDANKRLKVANAVDDNDAVSLLQLKGVTKFAGFEGPHSKNANYKNNWHLFVTNDDGEYFEAIGSGTDNYTGIKIKKSGCYYCQYAQRTGPNNHGKYGGISMNGNRGALEGSSNKIWAHNHGYNDGDYSESICIGHFSAGDIISAGPIYNLLYGNAGYIGFLIIQRIGDD